MFSAGRVNVNSGDSARNVLEPGVRPATILPSTSSDSLVVKSAKFLAQVRSSYSVSPLPSTVEHSTLRIGMNRGVPAGTLHFCRLAVPSTSGGTGVVVNVPTRKNADEDCP